jgi:hypothetical protein
MIRTTHPIVLSMVLTLTVLVVNSHPGGPEKLNSQEAGEESPPVACSLGSTPRAERTQEFIRLFCTSTER